MNARTLPHNLEAEESLLGAMLLSEDARVNVIGHITTPAFYTPSHGHIFESICALMDDGFGIDAATVSAHLGRRGLLEDIGGSARLIDLIAGTPSTSNALEYAITIIEEYERREAIGTLEAALLSVRDGVAPSDALGNVLDSVKGRAGSTWTGIDMEPYWTGAAGDDLFPVPNLGRRVDGQHVVAPNACGILIAPPESAKSLAAMSWCIEAAAMGRSFVYVDLESRAPKFMARMKQHIRGDITRSHMTYIRPKGPMTSADRWNARRLVANTSPALVVIDGYNSLLQQHKLDANSAGDIHALAELVIEPWRGPDTATVLIDHISKDDAKNGRFTSAMGSTSKTGLVDWAMAVVPDPTQRIQKGREGFSRLIIAKDRDGELRHLGNADAEFGRFTVRSDAKGRWSHRIEMPHGVADPTADRGPQQEQF